MYTYIFILVYYAGRKHAGPDAAGGGAPYPCGGGAFVKCQ